MCQSPGYSYPAPVSHMKIMESSQGGAEWFHGACQRETGTAAACPVATAGPCPQAASQEQ
jgi:hypothetical protein